MIFLQFFGDLFSNFGDDFIGQVETAHRLIDSSTLTSGIVDAWFLLHMVNSAVLGIEEMFVQGHGLRRFGHVWSCLVGSNGMIGI